MKLIFVFLLFTSSLFASSNKNILILNSYHKGFEFSDTIISNMEKIFYKHENINVNILYMDSKNIYSRDYIKELTELYSLQLKNRNYDLIITIDSFAYNLAVKNFNTIANNSPILFVGVEEFSQELTRVYNVDSKVYGIKLQHPVKKNIELIFKMMPNIQKLYILNDRSPNGNETSPLIIKAIKHIKSYVQVEYLRDDSLEDLTQYFSLYKPKEAILFIRYSNAEQGKFYKTNEVSKAIESFKRPVFVTDNLFLGKGALGGQVIPIHTLGINTARRALRILNNDYRYEKVSQHNDFKYIFDQKKLNQFHLRLPKELRTVQIINRPETFFEKYRKLIDMVFLATPFLLVIIIWLIKALYEKQQNDKKLRERIEFDKTLLNAIESPIYWQDKDGYILDANMQLCELLDVHYEDIIGNKMSIFNQSLTNHKIVQALEDLKAGKLPDSQLSIKNIHGEKKIYFINQTIYESNNSSGIVTIFTDITKEKEIEIEKQKNTQYLIQQSKLAEIGEIFSSIAHQWKSPLVAITALAQDMFYSNNNSGKEEDSYHINNIMVQAKYMTNTINEFQDFIMPSKQKTIFNVQKTIKAMLNIVRHNMKYNYITVSVNVAENTQLNVFGYENEFMQALLNIINNAKDALLHNNEKDRKIQINIYNKQHALIIDIIDNGPGISKESVDKIFIQYYSTKEKGHGIGLYMTKLIIEDKLEGKIHYKALEKGSCFRITLHTTG